MGGKNYPGEEKKSGERSVAVFLPPPPPRVFIRNPLADGSTRGRIYTKYGDYKARWPWGERWLLKGDNEETLSGVFVVPVDAVRGGSVCVCVGGGEPWWTEPRLALFSPGADGNFGPAISDSLPALGREGRGAPWWPRGRSS